jgi:mono/diheme cytochrome c family protein
MKKTIIVCLTLICAFTLSAQTKRKPTKAIAAKTSAPNTANGKRVFMQYCMSCHQADGGGVQNMNPPLIKTTYVLGDKTRLIKIVLNGLNEDIEINGDTYTNTMPSQDFLKDQEIADVLTYVRNNFGNKASAVTAAEVKKTRAANKK